MFGFKLKKRSAALTLDPENVSEKDCEKKEAAENFAEDSDNAATEISVLPAVEESIAEKAENTSEKADASGAVSDFARIAAILGKDEKTVIEECKLFQVRSIMSKLSKTVVRYGVLDGDMKKLLKKLELFGGPVKQHE